MMYSAPFVLTFYPIFVTLLASVVCVLCCRLCLSAGIARLCYDRFHVRWRWFAVKLGSHRRNPHNVRNGRNAIIDGVYNICVLFGRCVAFISCVRCVRCLKWKPNSILTDVTFSAFCNLMRFPVRC